MGYRELLKNYIRFLELHAGDNFIETIPDSRERVLSRRDLGELRSIAAEIYRESHESPERTRVENRNYRFRLLLNRYGLSVPVAAELAGVDEDRVRRWRTHPRSRRYLPMTAGEYDAFEASLQAYLDGEAPRGRG